MAIKPLALNSMRQMESGNSRSKCPVSPSFSDLAIRASQQLPEVKRRIEAGFDSPNDLEWEPEMALLSLRHTAI